MKTNLLFCCLVGLMTLTTNAQSISNNQIEKSPSILVVSTQAVTSITTISAVGNATINSLTGLTSYGICWSTSSNPTVADSKVDLGLPASTGAYTVNMTGLSSNTTYYVTGFATYNGTVIYGTSVQFTTSPIAVVPVFGDGTVTNPYQIATLENLYWLSQNSTVWTKSFIQTANIDATATSGWDSGNGFSPIGTSTGSSFKGSYNGLGFTISNLKINRTTSDYIGLFGCCYTGFSLSNIGLTQVNITGQNYVGGLVGNAYAGTITNCYTTGTVNGGLTSNNSGVLGGLCGYFNGTLRNSYSSCSVIGKKYAGGLIGQSADATINNCFSSGSVLISGTLNNTYAGGLISSCGASNGGLVSNCYSTATVTNSCTGGLAYGGGFGGAITSYTNVTNLIQNCYSAGAVSAPDYPFGFAARIMYTPTFNNCFYDSQTTGQANAAPSVIIGIASKLSSDMKTSATFTLTNWDFVGETTNGTNDYWNISVSQNNSYPFLILPVPSGLPVANSIPASNITNSGATLNGKIIAFNASTTPTFEYGLTTSYGTIVNADQGPITGLSSTTVNASITGLSANTTYHFRLNGANIVGTTNGMDQTFTTTIGTIQNDIVATNGLLYPNPASVGFTIEAGSKLQTINIYDINGCLKHSQQAIGKTYINISNFQKSIYFVKYEGQVYKLVKE